MHERYTYVMPEAYASRIRELIDGLNGDYGFSALFLLEHLEAWARELPYHPPVLLPDQSGLSRRLQRRLAGLREFVSENFLLPEKNTISSFITESELLAHDLLTSTLEKPWNHFRQEAQPVDGKRKFDNAVWREMETIRSLGACPSNAKTKDDAHHVVLAFLDATQHVVCNLQNSDYLDRLLAHWFSDTPVGGALPPFILGYVKSLEELFAFGEFIPRKAIIDLLRALLKFVHTAGIERHFPVSPGTWSDTENGEFGRIYVDKRALRKAAEDRSGFYFNKWPDVEVIEEMPLLEVRAYLEKGAYIMNITNDYNKSILYSYVYILNDIARIKRGGGG